MYSLSFPAGDSINDNNIVNHEIEVSCDGTEALANRVLVVAKAFPTLQRMMTGCVNGAFRNNPISADHVGRFTGTIPEFGILVVDLCCPFGWKNSPSSYWSTFDAKIGWDDHVPIEPDVASRLSEAQLELRSAMMNVVGPGACNEKTFTS
ncbi:hypothetical protein PHMEG_00015012 [Phytophthora megakarya]|uniref:Cleavage induced protein n=1 Tax=Phytophthora megakarya TaxID=4795 RepID=A0A225W2E0_9STRA|nr:hypothetical protein PHMEG_00015012 [Phytophthora megakarya]